MRIKKINICCTASTFLIVTHFGYAAVKCTYWRSRWSARTWRSLMDGEVNIHVIPLYLPKLKKVNEL